MERYRAAPRSQQIPCRAVSQRVAVNSSFVPRVARAWYVSTGFELCRAEGSLALIAACVTVCVGGDSDVKHATILLWHSIVVLCG